jgi:hypothetical protein
MELALVLRWIGWRGALALVLLASLAGQSWRLDVAQKALAIAATKQVTAERDAEHAARTEEQTRARYVDGVATAYEKGKADAQAAGERVAADLRAGNLQLRQRWQGCETRVSGAPASPGVADAEADDRAASAGRIVRAAAASDAQVEGLQALNRAERK